LSNDPGLSNLESMGFFLSLFISTAWAAADIPSASTSSMAAPKKNQLEELFIWKLSDELRLGPAEEKKFAELVRGLNQKKLSGSQKIEEKTKALSSAKTDKDRESSLRALRKAHQDYNQLSVTELDEMKKLLGLERLVSYLEIKQELTAKVKSLLIQKDPNKETSEKKELPPPQIIEEKK